MKEIRNFELEDKIKLINDLIRNKNLLSIINDNLGIHLNQSRGGTEITVSTIFAAISEYVKNEEGK
jgi:hypothetical protein